MDKKYEITCENINKLFSMKISDVNRKYGYYESVEDITVGEFLAKCILHVKAERGKMSEEKSKDFLYAINELKVLENEKRHTVGQDERAAIIENMKSLREYLTKHQVNSNVTVNTIIGRKK